MVKDCYEFPREIPWWIKIDWEETAKNVKEDYTTIDIDDETFYYR